MISRIDPAFIPVLTDLARGLRELRVPFCIIGALVPELLLVTGPSRMTNDSDVTVIVNSHDEFDHLKSRLGSFGFTPTPVPHRLQHRSGGVVDILPFSDAMVPEGKLELDRDSVLNMAGFKHVVPNALDVAVTEDLQLPVTPVPLFVLLKFVAFGDRRAPKDLASILHCLRHYMEDDDSRYGLDHGGEGVPFEYTCAYLTGLDCRRFLDSAVAGATKSVLDRFDSEEAAIVGTTARESGRRLPEPEYLADVFQQFRWFRLGAGI